MLCFSAGKIKIYIWFSFFATISLFLVLNKSEWGFFCVIASIFHEAGHLLAFLFLGHPPKELHFELSGIRLVPQKKLLSTWEDFLVLISGSLVNIILFFISLKSFFIFSFFNLAIAFFNLLPMKSLDGGQILLVFLQRIFGDFKGEKISEVIFGVTALALICGGIYLFLKVRNFTLLVTVFHLFLLSFFDVKKRL